MASLKAIRKRIVSVKNTQKITKAMKMVAAAKLRRAQDGAESARPYADKLNDLLLNVASRVGATAHPLLSQREQGEGDSSAAGNCRSRSVRRGYNSNLIRKAAAFLDEHGKDRVRVTTVGRRGFDYFKKRDVNIADKHINLSAGPDLDLATNLSEELRREYASGEADAVYVAYNRFQSTLVQVPTIERVLPIATDTDADGEEVGLDYIYEPEAAEILDRLLQQYVTVRIHQSFLEAIAGEHAARMTAMDSATNNASEMMERPDVGDEPRPTSRYHQRTHGDRGRRRGAERLTKD